MKNQNKDVAMTCIQTISNTTDIDISCIVDQKMLISVISATIEDVRKKQHEATKNWILEANAEFNGIDFELLETIEMPDIEL